MSTGVENVDKAERKDCFTIHGTNICSSCFILNFYEIEGYLWGKRPQPPYIVYSEI